MASTRDNLARLMGAPMEAEKDPTEAVVEHGSAPPPAQPAPAIGYSMSCNIGAERGITVQCFVGEDEDDRTINAKIDRVFRVMDRQLAKYAVDGLRKAARKFEEQLAKLVESEAVMENQHQKDLAQIDIEIAEYQTHADSIREAAYSVAAQTGRSNKAALAGQPNANIQRMEKAVKDATAMKERKAADREQFLKDMSLERAVIKSNLNDVNKQIADHEALLEG